MLPLSQGGLDNLDFSQFSASTLAVLRGVDQALKQYDFSQYKPTSSTDTIPKLQGYTNTLQ